MKPDFIIAFNKALSSEGLISNNKSDHGGFTYKGISRVKHPAWPGWIIIDAILAASTTTAPATTTIVPPATITPAPATASATATPSPKSATATTIIITAATTTAVTSILRNSDKLNNLVEQFYLTNFWNKIQGNLLPTQLIADELFESSINLGVPAASEILQRTINLLNRNARFYPDILVDGIIGTQTLAALNKSIAANEEKLLFNLLNFYQAKRYIEIMERDHSQEIFIGWFNRIEIIKT